MSEKRLKNQKKLSAATSIVGGTLGLSGLTALALKKPGAATKLNITAGGLGGVGAYNYASIQSQEAKKKAPRQNVYVVRNKKQIKNIKSGLQPVTKGLEVMDYGLSSVHQGENVISKAMPQKQKKAGDRGATAGQVAAPVTGYLGAQAFKGGRMGYGVGQGTRSGFPSSLATAGRTAGAAVKAGAKPGQMAGAAFKHPWATAGMMIGGGLAGQKAGHKLGAPKPAVGPKKPKSTMSKRFIPRAVVSTRKTPVGRFTSFGTTGAKNPLYEVKPLTGTVLRGKDGGMTQRVKGGQASLTPLGREVRNAAAVGTGAGLVYSGGKKALGRKKPEVHKAFKPKNPFSLKPMHTNFKHANTLRHNATRQSLRADDLQSRATAAYRNGDEAGANRLASKGNKVFMNSIRSTSGEGQHLYAAKQNAARARRNTAIAGGVGTAAAGGGGYAFGRRKKNVKKAFKPKNPFSLKPMHKNFKHAGTLNVNARRQSLRADDLQSRATAAYRSGDEAGANKLASKGNKVFMNGIRSSARENVHLYEAKQNAARARRNTAIAGGVGTAAAGGGGYEFGRRKKNVKKAYNPEAKRQRRLENGATALSVGSGATAAGAFHYGRKAAGAKGTGVKGLRAKSLTAYKGGLKNTAKAGGLGLTAVGLAVSSDRVRSYRSGRGGSYRQLHRGS